MVRSTVSVQSLINEYIPVTVPSVGVELTHKNEAEGAVGTVTTMASEVGLSHKETNETSTSASSTGQSVSCSSAANNCQKPTSTLKGRLEAAHALTTLTSTQRSGTDFVEAVQCTETPAIWNSWIYSVGQRFPMADMSVRQVLDILDRRSEETAVLEG